MVGNVDKPTAATKILMQRYGLPEDDARILAIQLNTTIYQVVGHGLSEMEFNFPHIRQGLANMVSDDEAVAILDDLFGPGCPVIEQLVTLAMWHLAQRQ